MLHLNCVARQSKNTGIKKKIREEAMEIMQEGDWRKMTIVYKSMREEAISQRYEKEDNTLARIYNEKGVFIEDSY